jgi:hypothetical protein
MPKTLKDKQIAKLKKAIKELKKKKRANRKATFEQRMNNNQKVIINSTESKSKPQSAYDGGNYFPRVIQNYVPYSNEGYQQFSSRLNALERLTPQNRQLDNPPLQQRVYHRNDQPQRSFAREDDQAGINLENNFNDQRFAQLGGQGQEDDDDQTVFDMTKEDRIFNISDDSSENLKDAGNDTELDEDGDEYERATMPLKPPSEPTPQMSPDLLEQQRVPDMTVKPRGKGGRPPGSRNRPKEVIDAEKAQMQIKREQTAQKKNKGISQPPWDSSPKKL